MKTLRFATPIIVLAAATSSAGGQPPCEATPAEIETAEATLEGEAAEVPFRTFHNLLLVDVVLNGGEPRPFILDTGAGGTVVDAAAAEVEPDAERGAVTVRGAGGDRELELVRLDSLALGGARLLGPTVARGDLTPLRELIGADIAGVLGYDFLRHFVVKVDYENSRVTFYEPASFAEPPGVAFIPADTSTGHPIVEMAVGDHRGRFVVDLGNAGPIIFDGGYVAEHDLIGKAAAKLPALMRGAGGPRATKAYVVRMDEATIAGYALAGPVVVLPAEAGAVPLCGEGLIGNVGWDVMSRFTFYVDYPGDRLGLAPSARLETPFDYDRTGLMLQYAGDHYVVAEVAATSPAASLLAPGDKVVAIDGKAAAEGGGGDGLVPPFKILDAVVSGVDYVEALTVAGHIYAFRVLEFPVAGAVRAPLAEERAGVGEVLNAVSGVFGDVDVIVRAYDDVYGLAELALARAKRAPFPKEGTLGGKILDAGVVIVRDVNVAVRGYVEAEDDVELAVARPLRPPLAEEAARRREIHYLVVAGVADVHVAVCGNGDAEGRMELGRTPLAEERAGGGEVLDAAIHFFDDVDVAVRGDRYVFGPVEFAISPPLRPPLAEERPGRGKILHAVVGFIDDVNAVSLRGDRDAAGGMEFAIPPTRGAPLTLVDPSRFGLGGLGFRRRFGTRRE
jgi:hypothetical protein